MGEPSQRPATKGTWKAAWKMCLSCFWLWKAPADTTVDGRNPAPPGMYQTTYQLVQDFFHQQYDSQVFLLLATIIQKHFIPIPKKASKYCYGKDSAQAAMPFMPKFPAQLLLQKRLFAFLPRKFPKQGCSGRRGCVKIFR